MKNSIVPILSMVEGKFHPTFTHPSIQPATKRKCHQPSVNPILHKLFYKVGIALSTFPKSFLIFSLLLTCGLTPGILRILKSPQARMAECYTQIGYDTDREHKTMKVRVYYLTLNNNNYSNISLKMDHHRM
jgi:hypothetical protein